MAYVSCMYAPPDPAGLAMPETKAGENARITCIDDQGNVWWLSEDSQVGDWLAFKEKGTVEPYVAPEEEPPGMNRTITVTGIEPAPLSLRWPLGINLDLRVTMLKQNGDPVDPTFSQFVLLPRSRGGVRPYDMEPYDVLNGIARVEIAGTELVDETGYSIELYSRRENTVPGDPPLPTGLLAKGSLVTEGSAYTSEGPLNLINVPVVVGPPGAVGAQGPAGASGSPGSPGTEGQRGSMWFTGTGPPTMTGDFVVGDMYLDSTNGDVWRWEGAAARWVHQ